MNIFDRFVLGVYTFTISIISAILVLISTKVIDYTLIGYYFDIVNKNAQYVTILIIVSIMFFLVSIRFLLSGPQKARINQPIRKKSELGDILISLISIQNIVMDSIKKIDGVMEQKITVGNYKDSVRIKLKVIVTPDKSIPELSEKIQSTSKEVIEKIAGVQVKSIEVYVDNVVQTIKPKVKVKNQVEDVQ